MKTRQKPCNPYRVLFPVILFLTPIIVQAQIKYLQNMQDMPPHPRILLLQNEEEQIKANIAADPAWAAIHQAILNECDHIIMLPEQERIQEGRRALGDGFRDAGL